MQQIKAHAEILRLTNLKRAPEEVIHQAQLDKPSYMDFILVILQTR
jgi:hypothetical protein